MRMKRLFSCEFLVLGLHVVLAVLPCASHASSHTQNRNPEYEQQGRGRKSLQNENERTVLKLICGLFRKRNLETIDKYIAEDYIQHSPTIADGREGLKAAAREWFAAGRFDYEVLRTGAADDMVWVHSRVVSTLLQRTLGGRSVAVVDIFRLEDGLVKEHWDVLTPEVEEAANNNSQF